MLVVLVVVVVVEVVVLVVTDVVRKCLKIELYSLRGCTNDYMKMNVSEVTIKAWDYEYDNLIHIKDCLSSVHPSWYICDENPFSNLLSSLCSDSRISSAYK